MATILFKSKKLRKWKETKEELEETKKNSKKEKKKIEKENIYLFKNTIKFIVSRISGIRQNYLPNIRPNQYLVQPYFLRLKQLQLVK